MNKILILATLIFSSVVNASYAQAQNNAGSIPDPYIMGEPNDPSILPGNNNIDGYTLANPLNIGGVKKCVVAFFGQSNSGANYQQDTYTIANPTAIWNLNPYNGGLYVAKYPLLGGGGPSAAATYSWVFRYADNLISGAYCDRVILVPAAISSTTAADWAVGGIMNNRIAAVAKRISANNLITSGVIYQQGEEDNAHGTSQVDYNTALTSVINSIKSSFPGVPIFVSETSYYLNTTTTNVTIPQVNAVDNVTVYSLGDSDLLGAGDRYDGTHFNSAGCTSWAGTAATNSGPHLITH